MVDLVIFGAGGMARETAYLIKSINNCNQKYNLIGFSVDDEFYADGTEVLGYPLLRKEWLISHRDNVKCICGVGYPKDRRRIMRTLSEKGIQFETLIDPLAYIAEIDCVGSGCIIGAYSFITSDVKIGNGVFLNGPMVVVGHGCTLEDYVTCFPKAQISGLCHIGEAALIGSMAYIHEGKKIGKEAVVAPGSVVLRNVGEGKHAIGNPAKIVSF